MKGLFITVAIVLVALLNSGSTEAFLLRRHANTEGVKIVTPATAVSGDDNGNDPATSVFFTYRHALYTKNVTQAMNLIAPNATGEFRTVGQPGAGGVVHIGPSMADWEKFVSLPMKLYDAIRLAFPHVTTTRLSHGGSLGIFTSTTIGSNAAGPSICYNSMMIELNADNQIIKYNQMIGAPNKTLEQSNTTAMLSFVNDFAHNLVVGQNATLLQQALTPTMFIAVSHENPVETEIIPGFIFASFMEQDWKDSTYSHYELKNAFVVQDYVSFEFSEVFLFAEHSMVKGFSFRARLVESASGSPLPFQIDLLEGIEVNEWGKL